MKKIIIITAVLIISNVLLFSQDNRYEAGADSVVSWLYSNIFQTAQRVVIRILSAWPRAGALFLITIL